jgi:5'-nucleotidase
MTIAGADIRTALEQALLPEFIHKPIKGYGFRGEVLGTLAIDGLSVTYDSTSPPMSRLIQAAVNGAPLEDERIYTVGTIDMFSFKAGYESLANAIQFNYYLPEFIRDVIADQLLNLSAISECRQMRWNDVSK